MIGRRLLHYEIIEKLGAGGMGVVYKARDTHLDRFVVLKVLPAERVADPTRKARFIQEAKAASALKHPNIVVVHDIASEEGADFIVMEYVAGKTLDQTIPRKGMRLNEALKIAMQVADAVARAHAAGIIHRDLKPSNLMVDEHGLVKVLDFGLAKLTEHKISEEASTETIAVRTDEGSIIGTPAYMSPEQAEGRVVGARSDIFSLGAVMYEMISGQRAFQGDSKISTLAALLNKDPAPLRGDVPQEVSRIIWRCLRKDPERRFQHMDDVRVALRELQEESDSGKLTVPAEPPPKRRAWKRAAVSVVVLLLLSAIGWIVGEALLKPAPPLETSILTSLPGDTGDPAFSPDGRQVAFSWNGEKQDKQAIYLKLIGSPTPKQLSTGPGSDYSPAFSPDGLSIAFWRWTPGKVSFVLMPAIGGPERILSESPARMNPGLVAPAPYFAWFPDGKSVVSLTPGGLAIASIETGERRPLTTTAGDVTPAVSPDGKMLAFARAVGRSGSVYILELTEDLRPKGEPRRLTPLTSPAGQPAWTADGRDVVFVSGGLLWTVPASGSSQPRRVALEDREITSPAISRNGERLVYRRSMSNINIWRSPLTGPESERIPQRLIASTRSEGGPQYSPDGSRIAFHSSRSGRTGVWVSDADGSNALELFTPPDGSAGSPRWSPDGQRIAFDRHTAGRPAIFTIAARGGAPIRLETNVDGVLPSWSRDGAWVYFSSFKTGRSEVWKAPQGGGPAQQVTTNGGFVAFESLDGKFLYYTKTDGDSGLWKVPTGGGEEVQILPSVMNRAFCVADTGIYFATRTTGGKFAIYFLSFATGQPHVLAILEHPLYYGLAVSPDGRFALYPQVDASRSELMLVENFR